MPRPGRLEGGHEFGVNKCTQPVVSGQRRSQVPEAKLASEMSALGAAGHLESPPHLSHLLQVGARWKGTGKE